MILIYVLIIFIICLILANITFFLLKRAYNRFPNFFAIVFKFMPKPAETPEERANELILTIFYLTIVVGYILFRNSYR